MQIKPLALRPVKISEDETVQELSRPHRSNSKEQLSEVSAWTRPFPFHKPRTESQAIQFHRPRQGTPQVGYGEQADSSNTEDEIRGQLVQ